MGDTHTYTLADDPSGFFEIVGDEIRVKVGATIDFETATSHEVIVETTDLSGNTYAEAITLTVIDGNDAPTDLDLARNSGIDLNTDGGNNAYLYTSNGGDILGGLSALTIEVDFSTSHVVGTDVPLFSYHAGGASDEIELAFNDYGSGVELYLEIGEQATGVSGYDASQLFDGAEHHVALTWDNTTGAWEINLR